MPNIKPFYALLPAAHLQERVVTRPLEDYSTGEAKLIASENEYSFLHLINPELDNPYLRGTRQELVFKKISENLELLLERKVLLRTEAPSIFIYRVKQHGEVQTGIWTITHINDYLSGKIKKHEHTVERRERSLAEYLEQTKIDANPVLITYAADERIDALMERYLAHEPTVLDFTFTDQSVHQVWQVAAPGDVAILTKAFGEMDSVYIADGHHRIASAAKLNNAAYFTSVYMSTTEVKVLEFNRLVRDLGTVSTEALLNDVKEKFVVEPQTIAVKPSALHELGMYVAGQWYLLKPKPETFDATNPVDVLDVSILQNLILEPLLHIKDPRTDARLTFRGGRIPVEELQMQVDNGLFAIAFTLYPVSIAQLIAVADAGGIMPPKSTWVEPKFLVGLITQYLS